ncbi:hypothetical protein DIPPA_16864 [Diplonema papillatum]|nr:hypothetical protein DIPPA_16864 [Diplonema papillatum]
MKIRLCCKTCRISRRLVFVRRLHRHFGSIMKLKAVSKRNRLFLPCAHPCELRRRHSAGPPVPHFVPTAMALYWKLFDDEVVLKDLVSRTKIPRRMLIGPAVKVWLAAAFAGAAALAAATATASHRASQLSPAEYAGVTLLATPVESSSSAPCSYLRTTSALVRQSLISSRFAVANARSARFGGS